MSLQPAKGCFPSSSVQYCIQHSVTHIAHMPQFHVSVCSLCVHVLYVQLPEGSLSKNVSTMSFTDAGKPLPKGLNSVAILDTAFTKTTRKCLLSENTTTGLGPDRLRLSLSVCEVSALLSSCALLL